MSTERAYARPRLSVIVLVTAGERDDLDRCLASVEAHPAAGGQEIIIVDNDSGDGSPEMVAEKHPAATVIRHERNLGVSAGRNAGMRIARGLYVAMLDSDVVVREGALETLCAYLDANSDVGLVGPRIEYPDGTLQLSARRVPTPLALIANRATGIRCLRESATRRRHLMVDESHDRTMEVDYLLGATMVFRAEVAAQTRGFDPRMTLGGYGFDDVDWAVSARERGWRVVYLPVACVTHVYRRRLAERPLAIGNAGMVASYVLFRAKHAGRRADGKVSPARSGLVRTLGEPSARILMRFARLSGRRVGAALVYHRIAPRTGDPAYELVPAHGAELFASHLRHLATTYRVVPASQLVGAAAARRRGQRFPVAITFDDDLASHTAYAMPMLKAEGLTATFFVGGTSLDGAHAYWWERLQAVVDAGRGAELAGVVPGEAVTDRPWSIHGLAAAIESQTEVEQAAVAAALDALGGAEAPGAGMRRADVAALADGGMEVGFHTRRHAALPRLDGGDLAAALVEGRAEIEALTSRPVTTLGYPHGKAGEREAEAARAAGYRVAFTSAPGLVVAGSDPLLLGRIEPSFVAGGHFAAKLAVSIAFPGLIRTNG